MPIVGRNVNTSPTTITFSAIGSTMTRSVSMMLVSATKQLRGGVGLVGRLAGVHGMVHGMVPSTPRRILLMLSKSANRGTFVRTHRFAGTASIATLTIAGLSKATGNNMILNVTGRFGVPMGFVKINRGVRSLRVFSGGTFMSSLFS